MGVGLLFGLLSAFGLGGGNVLGAIGARRVGSLAAAASTLVIAFICLIAYAYATGSGFVVESKWVPRLVLLGSGVAVSYYMLFRALALGPVSVVSAVTASSGAATAIFAFLFFGEHLGPLQWLAVPVTTVGAVLVSVAFVAGGNRVRLIGRGPLFAAISVATGAISNAGLRDPIRDIGPLPAILTQRAVTVAVVLGAVALAARRPGVLANVVQRDVLRAEGDSSEVLAEGGRARGVQGAFSLLLVLGLLDAFTFVAFAEGLVRIPAWLIGIVSQSGRVVAVLGGIVFFKEHLRRSQWWGIGLVVLGLTFATLG